MKSNDLIGNHAIGAFGEVLASTESKALLAVPEHKQACSFTEEQCGAGVSGKAEAKRQASDSAAGAFGGNFFAVDTETSGKDYNDPVQVSIVIFKDWVEVDSYNRYFLPRHYITEEAQKIHGLTVEKL